MKRREHGKLVAPPPTFLLFSPHASPKQFPIECISILLVSVMRVLRPKNVNQKCTYPYREKFNRIRIAFCEAVFIRCETTSKHCRRKLRCNLSVFAGTLLSVNATRRECIYGTMEFQSESWRHVASAIATINVTINAGLRTRTNDMSAQRTPRPAAGFGKGVSN